MQRRIEDTRIQASRALLPPAILIEEIARTEKHNRFIAKSREAATDIVTGKSKRLLVIVGPCSIHDPCAARDYADKLRKLAKPFEKELEIVMRTYFEKPRTVVGWKGYINDPDLDGSHRINKGLREARTLLRDLTEMGMPAATEFLDPTVPQYIADFITWGAIGARTSESQPHRELASGLSMPVGFKNPTDGRIQAAVDAVAAARTAHWFASITRDGIVAHFQSKGNDSCHVILRGGSKSGPNYSAEHVDDATQRLETAHLPGRVMIDCSHGNSGKDAHKQTWVAKDVADQVRSGSGRILGVMIESNLVAGRQDWRPDVSLVRGQSITDACVSLEETTPILETLAEAIARSSS